MPGVGRKSAQRIAFHLLERDRDGASTLSTALWLVEQGIESMSLNPDSVIETWLFLAGESV